MNIGKDRGQWAAAAAASWGVQSFRSLPEPWDLVSSPVADTRCPCRTVALTGEGALETGPWASGVGLKICISSNSQVMPLLAW